MASQEIREIRVMIDTQGAPGLKDIASTMARMNKSVRDGASALQKLEKAFFAISSISFAGIGLINLTQAMDSYQKLGDRIKVFEGSQVKANDTMQALARIADNTRSSIEGVATVYSRLALSLSDTGIKSDSLLFITEQLQNSFRLAGATAAEATGATIQLSQGLASGTLRGQELRSVLESNAIMGEILSKELGKPRGELMKLAEAGKITADVFLRALANGAGKISKDAALLGVTFREAADRGLNKFNIALGELNKNLGLSALFDKAIQGLTSNLALLASVAAGLAVTTLPLLYKQLATIAAIATAPLTAIAATTAALAGLVAVATFGILEPDLFDKIGLQVRGSLIIAFADLSYLLWDVVRGFSLIVSFGKGDFLTDIANKGLQSAKQLKDQAVRDIGEVEEAYQRIKAGDEAVKNIGVLTVEKQIEALKKFLEKSEKKEASTWNFQKSLATLNQEFLKEKNVSKYNAELRKLKIKDLDEAFKKGGMSLAEYDKKMHELNFGKPRKSLDDFRLDLSKLNFQLSTNKITIGQYADALEQANIDKLNRDMKTGRANALELNESFNTSNINEWRRALYEGSITLSQFRFGTQAEAVNLLNQKFASGKIDVYEFNKQMTEISDKFHPGSSLFTGIADYISSAGTLSQNVASAITNTFTSLEKSFLDFIETGKFNFQDFTKSVLADLNKIIVKSLIIRPLAEAIIGFVPTGGASGANATTANGGGIYDSVGQVGRMAAKGAAFDGMASNFFANGGVVSGRTGFNYGGGKKGVMGEAGPEAILPLSRNKNGELGVATSGGSNVTVNVINNGDSSIKQEERQGPGGERILDIIIAQKVKEGFASGMFDKTLSSQYGLRRRGI